MAQAPVERCYEYPGHVFWLRKFNNKKFLRKNSNFDNPSYKTRSMHPVKNRTTKFPFARYTFALLLLVLLAGAGCSSAKKSNCGCPNKKGMVGY
jgi:hypothetical protein